MPRAIAALVTLLALTAAAPAAAEWRFTSVRHSIIGKHLRGAQFVGGVRVDGSAAIVNVVDGRVVSRDFDARRVAPPVSDPIGARAARAAALGRLGVALPTQVSTQRLLTRRGDAYRVTVLSLRPAVAATVDVAAADGRVLAVRDDNDYENAVGTVFDPNPIVTSHDASLRQPGEMGLPADADLDSAELTAELEDLPVRDYDLAQAAAGRLVGPWAQVQGAEPYVAVGGRIEMTRGMPGFEGLMVYAHIDRYQRYLQDTLGFRGEAAINAEPQDAYALPVAGFDNSFYQPANDLLLFGAGGVDDGEDAEVILHEYGHAVHDAQVKGWGATHEGGAMGEGFGDFQAAAFYAREDSFGELCVMDWDATSYDDRTPPCLRRLDTTRTWPRDRTGSVHTDGEIWSAFLWRVRSQLGATPVERSDNALKLVLASHELLSTTAEFDDAVAALRTAARALGRPEWEPIVVAEARASGFIA